MSRSPDLTSYIAERLIYSEAEGYACTGVAKIIIDELAARFNLVGYAFDLDIYDDAGHTYVIFDGQDDEEFALNQFLGTDFKKVRDVRSGIDVTIDIVNSKLRDHRL